MEFAKLVALLIFPILLVFIFLGVKYCFFVKNKKFLKWLWDVFSITDGKLHEQYVLWMVLLLPVLYFFVLGVPVWSEYYLSVNSEGINNFFSISKNVFWVAGLALPLGVLVARMHATVQMDAQIKSNNEQNVFVKFYKHREFILSEIKEICEENSLELFLKTDVYHEIFPSNSPAGPFSTALDGAVVEVIDAYLDGLTKIAKTHSLSEPREYSYRHFEGKEALSDIEAFIGQSWFRSSRLASSKQAATWDTVSEQEQWFLASDVYLDLHIALLGIKQLGHK